MTPIGRLFLASLAVCCAGCGPGEAPAPPPPPAPTADAATSTLADVARASSELTSFMRLVEAAGLAETLADTSRAVTLFAPSNAAVQAAGGTDALAALPDLRERLLAHAIATRLYSTDALGAITLDALDGGALTLDSGDGSVTVSRGGSRASVVTPDLDADNGVVHVIDAVLAP